MTALSSALLVSLALCGAEENPEQASQRLAQANEALLLEDWDRAAVHAFGAMQVTKPSADKYESAQFVLGESLSQLGLTQAAAEHYFAVIEQRQNPALLPRALSGLEKLVRRGLVDEDKLFRGVLVEADLATVTPQTAAFMSYFRGLSNLRLGYRRWAERDFRGIGEDNYYARRAKLVKAVTLVKDGKPAEAVPIVDTMLEDESIEKDIRDELTVMRARLLYEAGKTAEAIETYKKVRRTRDTPAGELLLERAWAHFRNGDYHDAMGLLYALGAPSSRQLFLPGQYVLRGLIYQKFCHFRAAKAAVRDFREKYGPSVSALERGERPRAIPNVVDAAQRLPELETLVTIRRALAKELKYLEDNSGSFEGGLAEYLTNVYTMLGRKNERDYNLMLDTTSEWIAEGLLRSNEQANLLHYEVGVSIFKSIESGTKDLKRRVPAEEVPTGGKRIYFKFDGEFWSDELQDMRFLIQDRCVE